MKNEILISNCCGAADRGPHDGPKYSDMEVCPACHEHCEFLNEEEICVECDEVRPDDERVKTGMKCSQCAY